MADEPAPRLPELLAAHSETAPVATADQDRPLDPEKLLRLAGLVRAVLDEVRQLDPDQATAAQLGALHGRVTAQVEDALPNALREELEAIDLAPGGNYAKRSGEAGAGETGTTGATGQEVRFAYAGLIGWLSGLFQGLQAAMQVQQMQAMNALPGGGPGGPAGPDGRQGHGRDIEPGTGHYL
ncbi:MAG TPA: proteasome activator [Actinomycetota bacterium]|nr:proteasome activator [Actinomycetota bacterium]